MHWLSLEAQKGPDSARWERGSHTGLSNEGWCSGFIGAIVLHVVLAMLFVLAPGLLERHIPMPPVYTVRLFETANIPPPGPLKAERHVAETKARAVVKRPKETRKVTKKRSTMSLKARPKTKKVISIHPTRPKTKRLRVVKKRKVNTEEFLKRRLKKIEQEVEEKREEAFLQERLKAIRSSVKGRAKKAAVGPARGWTGTIEQSEALRLYCTEIWAKVRIHWVLPEQLLDRKGVVSVVVVQIAQDGTILKTWYEHRSGYALFDQSALNAVKEAGPFPPLPRILRPGPVEIGIRFRPGEID